MRLSAASGVSKRFTRSSSISANQISEKVPIISATWRIKNSNMSSSSSSSSSC